MRPQVSTNGITKRGVRVFSADLCCRYYGDERDLARRLREKEWNYPMVKHAEETEEDRLVRREVENISKQAQGMGSIYSDEELGLNRYVC